ncbi:hypothetical protein [Lyngbya confervoides]|uniref:Uncharacterized protein n=1 Tax=Lyngbya confervoides BDU141951 TaxID=1574623 RepID=A0ABD4T130_9CYAN|nr:hypothetical protein [Lyngbya confervoides]MCM1982274.1 hypothetical protein [Lyngbya confervoides BDU141951]
MFSQGFQPGFLSKFSNDLHLGRVLDLYNRRHRDDLLGFGYHHYLCQGRGLVVLVCTYRELYFEKGFNPTRRYLAQPEIVWNQRHFLPQILDYDPHREILVRLEVQNTELQRTRKLSKRGLSLAVVHRQYLNQLLDYVAAPGAVHP